MKLLQVISSLHTGGAEKLIVDSVPLYQQEGLEVDVLCLNSVENSFWENLREKSTGKIYGLTKGSVYNPFLVFKIIPYLKRYDLVHVHLFPALYWVVFAKIFSFSKVKVVYTEHSTYNRRRNSVFFKIVDRFVYSKLVHVGCISVATQNNLKKHLESKKNNTSIILNGIDLSAYKNTFINSSYSFFEDNSFVIIQVSSFRDQKDQPTLIKALKQTPNKIKLLLVGDGHLRESNEVLVKRLGLEKRVLFLGNRFDIPMLLNYADVSVLSSNYEGFGLAILEGMASGKPSIASNIDGVREIVEDYGLLFEKGNSNELASQILKLYEDKIYYAQIAEKCLKRAKDFDIKKMVNNYVKLYKKVINNG